jgi:hypothetical protein
MRRIRLVFAIFLIGCGTAPLPPSPTIVNQTNGYATDAQLQSQFATAQHTVGVSGTFDNEVTLTDWIVDSSALNIQPDGIIVRCEADDPPNSNTFSFEGRKVHGYADLSQSPPVVTTACSGVGEIPGQNNGDAEYEFENYILWSLGYSVENR